MIDSFSTWWRHQMETFSALLAICAGNSPVPGEFPTQRLVTRSSDVFFNLCLNKQLSKQSRGWWFETLSRPILRHRNDIHTYRHSSLIISRFCDFGVFCLKYFTICMSVTSVSNRNELTQHWYQDMNKELNNHEMVWCNTHLGQLQQRVSWTWGMFELHPQKTWLWPQTSLTPS